VTAIPAPRPSAASRGATHWFHGYRTMLLFELVSARLWLPILLFVQVMMGAGMAVMYGFFLGDDLPPMATTFIATGIPALSLIPVGMVAVPNAVGQRRMDGSYDFVWSLPVPRSAATLATLTVYTLVALPGTAVAMAVAVWRYDVTYLLRPSLVPAVLLVGLMSASVGFGLAHAVEDARITNLITNVLIFFVLLFSPIIVPVEQFPHWLATIHHWLPFEHMAVVLRASLSDGLAHDVARSYLVLGAWTLAAWTAAARAIGRRR
jgi:ABC-2 type transport system permease protein